MRRMIRWLAAITAAIILALGLGTLVPRPLFSGVGSSRPEQASGSMRLVVLLKSAIHTDIAFPADPDVRAAFGFLADSGLDPATPGAEWIIAGWGGRAFYINTPTWSDLRPGPVFKALTVDSAVMHMALGGRIDMTNANVLELRLSEVQFTRLLEAVTASFSDGTNGPMLIEGKSYGQFDRFYEANGWFNILVGCNVWTGAMLREAGLVTGFWTPLPELLFQSLKLHNSEL